MLVLEVLPKVEAVILRLTSLKFHPGNNMREFMSKYNPEEKMFGDLKLHGPCNTVDYMDSETRKIPDAVIRPLIKGTGTVICT